MATRSRSAAAKKAWATRRKLYGKSGMSKSSNSKSRIKKSKSTVSHVLRTTKLHDSKSKLIKRLQKEAGLTKEKAVKRANKYANTF